MTDTAARRATRALAAATFLGLAALSILRYLSFKTHVHDLGLISQSLFALRRGELLTNSINPLFGMPPSYLGNHFSPSMVVFAPLLWLTGSPIALLVTQAAVMALAPLVLYAIARRSLEPAPSLAISAAYVLHPGFWFTALYDFHQESCLVTLGLIAWWLMEEERWTALFWLLLFIAGLKEESALWVAGLGVVMAIRGRKREGAIVAGAAGAWFLLVMFVLMPALSPSGSISQIVRRFGHLGGTPAEVLTTCLARPWVPLAFLCSSRHLKYLVDLAAPWLFLPLAAPTPLIVPAGVLLLHMLSQLEISYDIAFYHHDSTLPLLAIATVAALARLGPRLAGKLVPLLWINAIGWHVIASSAYLPDQRPPLSPLAIHEDYAITPHEARLGDVCRWVTPGAPLATSAFLASWFTDREYLAPFPRGLEHAQELLVDLTNPYAHRQVARRFWLEWALQEPRGGAAAVLDALDRLGHDPAWSLVREEDGYYFFVRSPGAGVASRPALSPDGFLAAVAAARKEWLSYPGRGYGSRQ